MKKQIWLIMLALLLILTGCSRKKENAKEPDYRIYYLDSSMTTLVTNDYNTETTDVDELIRELVDQFLHVPRNLEYQVALPEKVSLLSYRQDGRGLFLYFDNGYSNRALMSASREILCRAALTKTLTQIPQIDFISIYVGDQPLLDAGGNPVGVMRESDFVSSISDVNMYEKTELTLYFADETGEYLVPEKREVMHSINTSLERLILEELIKGPYRVDHRATVADTTRLLNVTLNDNVCYINFDNSFLNTTLEIPGEITIYSIVNSLSESAAVSKVQITVNGEKELMFRDMISLDTLFERNLEIGVPTTTE